MLDDRVRAVLARLEAEDADERARGVPREQRSRQVARTTGQFLFALVAPQTDCEVLEIGGSRGYSTIWLAAGVRHLGGRVLSLEHDPDKCAAWRRNVADAGLEETAELLEGDAFETLPAEASERRARRRRQRALARRDARGVLDGPSGRPDARERDRPTRSRARAQRRPSRARLGVDPTLRGSS